MCMLLMRVGGAGECLTWLERGNFGLLGRREGANSGERVGERSRRAKGGDSAVRTRRGEAAGLGLLLQQGHAAPPADHTDQSLGCTFVYGL